MTPSNQSIYKVSVSGAMGTGREDLTGDYILAEIPRTASGERRWEVSFPAMAGFQKLCLTARDGKARLFFQGTSESPVWTHDHFVAEVPASELILDPSSVKAAEGWPKTLTLLHLGDATIRQPIRLDATRLASNTATSSGGTPEPPPQERPCENGSGQKTQGDDLGEGDAGGDCGCCDDGGDDDDEGEGEGDGDDEDGQCDDNQQTKKKPKKKKTPRRMRNGMPGNNAAGGQAGPPGFSGRPIRYFNGEIQLAVQDLIAHGFGDSWGQTRTYSNQMSTNYDFGNGYNWLVRQWPYIKQLSATSYVVVKGTRWSVWFDQQTDGSFVARYGALQTLNHTGTSFFLANTNGQVWEFNDFVQPAYPAGTLKSFTAAGGDVTEVTAYAGNQIAEVQRSYDDAGTSTIEAFVYGYVTSGENAGDLESVTLRRQVSGNPWSDIRRVTYTYYGSTGTYGSQGDLQTATQQMPSGTSWGNKSVNYYRYYTDPANAHLLKYVVEPAEFVNLAAAIGNPLAATDSQVAQYARYYFEYDAQRRVITETVDGGTGTYRYQYVDNGSSSTDYNAWKIKTTETLPDGATNVVYTNFIGQVLLKQLLSPTGDSWVTDWQFDANGRSIFKAEPSAVTSFSEGTNTLAVVLNPSNGLIRLTSYLQSPDPAAGLVATRSVQQGSLGTPVIRSSYTYATQSARGATVHPISTSTVYRNADGTGAITTSYSYQWYPGTVQVQQRTKTFPDVPPAQNGFQNGTTPSDTQLEYYDQYGNMTWEKGPRGFIDNYSYDVVTGGMTEAINDVNTSIVPNVPAGWVTPSGGGLNLITDYLLDDFGRTTQALGPLHSISGVAVRTAAWMLYDDVGYRILQANGYATGIGPNYRYTLINPVSVSQFDASNQPTDAIQAVSNSTSGPPSVSDVYPQSSWVSWSHNIYDNAGRRIAQRAYSTIPSSGNGVPGTNYDETDFGYDVMNRQNTTRTPGGTITRIVFDVRDLPTALYVGTNAAGATNNDPAGGGAAGNNMVQVAGSVYDGGAGGGDGNLTQLIAYADSTTTRVTNYSYDWLDRQISIAGALGFYQANTYDNLDQLVQVDRKNGSASGTLVSRSQTSYDNRQIIYATIVYGVDPDSGAIGPSLTNNFWHDAAGNLIISQPAGSQAFTKLVYDGLGRQTLTCTGYGVAGDLSLAADTIFTQTQITYDEDSNVLLVTSWQRFDSATGVGPLNFPYSGNQPLARTTYTANWYDGIGRVVASGVCGTNGNTVFTYPSAPPSSSDSVLVTLLNYDTSGNQFQTTDPAGAVTQRAYNALGKVVTAINNYTGGSPGISTDVTVKFAYNSDGNLVRLTAVNPTTGDQTTTYVYGSTVATSAIASNDLLVATIYPDSVAGSDQVIRTFNRQGQVAGLVDQNGNVHQYLFDLLGRPTDDIVGVIAAGVDASVQRIGRSYEIRGLVYQITSYQDAAGTVIANQVQNEYNSFQQLVTQYQEHGGGVDPSTSPQVDYSFADGSNNTVRPTSLVYPSGRVISFGYGATAADDDQLSRISSFFDVGSGTTLVNYTYLGLGTYVESNAPQPNLTWTVKGGSGSNPYTGLDQFGRVVNCLWTNSSNTVDQIQYGYNQASSRIWRADPVASTQSPPVYQDELYGYDGLQRLTDMRRGQLTLGNTNVSNLTLAQQWDLDATGNWSQFMNTDPSTPANNLDQLRTSNLVNEITQISQHYGTAWAQPGYDRAGNMTTTPQPDSPTAGFSGIYDAWNRLVSLAGFATYAYDGLDRRVSLTTSVTTRDYYLSAQWQTLEERVSTSASRARQKSPVRRSLVSSTAAERQFVWGLRYIDDLIVRDRAPSGNGSLTERLYAIQDANWNVTAISDAGGAIYERYRYSSYGIPTFLDSSFTPKLFGGNCEWDTLYCSYRWDVHSGLYYVRYRYLSPLLASWMTRDPFPPRTGTGTTLTRMDGTSLYAVARTSPLNRVDPLGLQSIDCTCGEAVTQVSVVGPLDANTAKNLANEALKSAEDAAPLLPGGLSGLNNGPADAFRHCYWSCLMAQKIGAEQAKKVGDIHEACRENNPPGEVAMDQANNSAGREFGKVSNPSNNCWSSCFTSAACGNLQISIGGTLPGRTPPGGPYTY
jgi:RHS repeat-associated protein